MPGNTLSYELKEHLHFSEPPTPFLASGSPSYWASKAVTLSPPSRGPYLGQARSQPAWPNWRTLRGKQLRPRPLPVPRRCLERKVDKAVD